MMALRRLFTIAVAALLASCSPADLINTVSNPEAGASADARPNASASIGDCPDDGPRLPGTGICAGRAHAYLNVVEGAEPSLPAGCDWVTNESLIADGSEALLYRAARCNGVVTTLTTSIGANSASVEYVTSALRGDAARGEALIRVFHPDQTAPERWIETLARGAMAQDGWRSRCAVRTAKHPIWPADSLVVGLSAPHEAPFRRKAAEGGPRAACGPYGLAYGEHDYWRLFQAKAWFFQFGAGPIDIDPRSVTWIVKDPSGSWNAPQ